MWIWGKSVFRRGIIKCKGLEVVMSLVFLGNFYGFGLINWANDNVIIYDGEDLEKCRFSRNRDRDLLINSLLSLYF